MLKIQGIKSIAGLAVWAVLTTAADGSEQLEKLRNSYGQQMQDIASAQEKSAKAAGAAYLRTLKSAQAYYRKQGRLDEVLSFRQEHDRYLESKELRGEDVVLVPEKLAEVQRKYLGQFEKLEEEGAVRQARLTRSYLGALEKLKQQETRAGRIDSAVAINEEQKQVSAAVDLSALEEKADPKRPKTPKAAPSPPGAPVNLAGRGIHPPRDQIWLYVMERGRPAPDVQFVFLGKGSKTAHEKQTDRAGKITLHVEKGESFRVMMFAEDYASQEVETVEGGQAFRFDLGGEPDGRGYLMTPKTGKVEWPGIGRMTIQQWSSSDGTTGPAVKDESRKAEIRNKGSSHTTWFSHARPGRTYEISLGDVRYEWTIGPLPDDGGYLILYKKI